MSEGGIGFNAWHNATTIHPLGLIVTLVFGVALVIVPRRFAIAPMVFLACFVPSAQRIVITGADFDLLRILVVFAWTRLLSRSEFEGFAWNRLDTMMIAWMGSGTLIYVIANGTFSALVNRCGWMFDGFGMYFFFRCVLREWRDVDFLVRTIILICIPVALAFFIERSTGRNGFAIFGGVSAVTLIRDGRLRCQGAFSHPILAGCFWAGTMPWMMAYVMRGPKWLAGVGLGGALMVIIACSSSTPLLALAFMLIGMFLYFVRGYMRLIRWGFLGVLVALHFTMDKPVWHLLTRVNVTSGSTGWHRYMIMDATINNFSKWWILGESAPTSWGVWQMRDITNQYILEALRGGLLALVCFIVMIGVAFGLVGKALNSCGEDTAKRVLVWSAGAALFTHVSIFFAVSYFGQIIMMWYLTLAIIGSLPGITKQATSTQPAVPTAPAYIRLGKGSTV